MQEPQHYGKTLKTSARRESTVATLITGENLVIAVRDQTFIKNGSEACAEGAKYDFRMGFRLLKASYGNPIDTRQLPESERGKLYLDPGEMAFVLTEEALDLPANMVAVVSPKRKLSHDGILVLGGFFIDPLYQGNLLAGLYNFSNTRWPLQSGKKLVAVVLYRLEEGETGTFERPEAIVDFPDELVRVMHNYRPVTLHGLQENIAQTRKEITELREEFRTQEDWKRTFRESLDRHDRQIGEMLEGVRDLKKSLEDERVNRLAKETQLGTALEEIGKRGERRYNLWLVILGALLGALLAWGVSVLWPSTPTK